MGRENPNKHDSTRDGQGVYQPDKTESPKNYERGKHERGERDDPPGRPDDER